MGHSQKTEQAEYKGGKMEEEQQGRQNKKREEGSSGTNLGWSERCRDAEMGIDSKNA